MSRFKKHFASGIEDVAIVRMASDLRELKSLLVEVRDRDRGKVDPSLSSRGITGKLSDHLVGDPEQDPFSSCLRSEMVALLLRAVANLSEKQRRILRLYYFETLTMKEIGARLRVGESRVCQIHAQAMLQLRTCLQSRDANNRKARSNRAGAL